MKPLSSIITSALVLFTSIGVIIPTTTFAADCADYYTSSSTGALDGYLTASNLPSSENKIYLDSLTGPAPSNGSPYAVSYNTATGAFTGKAYLQSMDAFLDFDYGTTDQARLMDLAGTYFGGFRTGSWEGEVLGLNNMTYNGTSGVFQTQGTHNVDADGDGTTDFTYSLPYDKQYVSGSSSGDVLVGLGDINFSNATLNSTTTVVPTECQETIDLLVNGSNTASVGVCGQQHAELTWVSNNVTGCTTDQGPWISPGSRANQNLTPENSQTITQNEIFSLKCSGVYSSNTVYGMAQATCSTAPSGPAGVGTGNTNDFEFIES